MKISLSHSSQLKFLRQFTSKTTKYGFNTPYPNVPPLKSINLDGDMTPTIKTLSNHLRVATQKSFDSICVVGAFIEGGSIYETQKYCGCSQLVCKNLFSGNEFQTTSETQKILDSIGANTTTSLERDHAIAMIEVNKGNLEEAVKQLAYTLQNMTFDREELENLKTECKYEYDDYVVETPEVIAPEWIHAAAFGDLSPYGHSLFEAEEVLANITPEMCRTFYKSNYTAPRTVISGIGMENEELVELVNKYLTKYPEVPDRTIDVIDSTYHGGDSRCEYELPSKIYEENLSHIMIGFEGPSWKSDDFFPAAVLNSLMGGGSSFSSGGPGKGMYSRLYVEALTKYSFARHFKHFVHNYDNCGIMGIHGICPADYGVNLTEAIATFLKTYDNFRASKDELNRAKGFLKSTISMNLECRTGRCEDLGRQLLVYGKPFALEDIIPKIDDVSLGDIKRVAKTAFDSPICYSCFGKTDILPSYEEISSFIKD